jgi:hypothetical protein
MRKIEMMLLLCMACTVTLCAQNKNPKPIIYYVEDSTADITVWVDDKVEENKNTTREDAALNKLNADSIDFVMIDGIIMRPDRSKLKVVSIPGFTQSELCNRVLDGVNKVYGSNAKVAKKDGDESIVISAFANNMASISISEHMSQIKVDGYYNIKMKFKDGQIMVDAPEITGIKSKNFNLDKSKININVKELSLLDSNGVQGFPRYLNDKIDDIIRLSFQTEGKN